MADPQQNSFENLTHSSLVSINSKENKEINLRINTYGGRTSFTVFTPGGGKPWSKSIPRKIISLMIIVLRKMKASPEPQRKFIVLSDWDPENKRMNQSGQIGFSISETQEFAFDLKAADLQGSHTFVIKRDGKFDFSQAGLTERDYLEGTIDWLIGELQFDSMFAERLSSFKPPRGGGFGGNRGGGGGGGGYQNRPRQPQQNQSSTFGVGDDDMSF